LRVYRAGATTSGGARASNTVVFKQFLFLFNNNDVRKKNSKNVTATNGNLCGRAYRVGRETSSGSANDRVRVFYRLHRRISREIEIEICRRGSRRSVDRVRRRGRNRHRIDLRVHGFGFVRAFYRHPCRRSSGVAAVAARARRLGPLLLRIQISERAVAERDLSAANENDGRLVATENAAGAEIGDIYRAMRDVRVSRPWFDLSLSA
jgi:hypothetical protein